MKGVANSREGLCWGGFCMRVCVFVAWWEEGVTPLCMFRSMTDLLRLYHLVSDLNRVWRHSQASAGRTATTKLQVETLPFSLRATASFLQLSLSLPLSLLLSFSLTRTMRIASAYAACQ